MATEGLYSHFPSDVVICRYDYRIKYFNLKKTRSQNALALEDVHRLWIPFLVFDNTEKNEATKVFPSPYIYRLFFILNLALDFILFDSLNWSSGDRRHRADFDQGG